MRIVVPHWVVGGLAVVAFVCFVAHKQHSASENYQHHRAEYCAALAGSPEQKKACIEEHASPRDYLPWWYELVGWPDGITTWAIILTGFAIAWQSNETRRAASAASAGVEVAVSQIKATKDSQRARIVIEPPSPPSHVEIDLPWDDVLMKVENVGYSHAFDVTFDAYCEITMSVTEPVTRVNENIDKIDIVRVSSVPVTARIEISAAQEMWKNVIRAGAKDLFMHLWGCVRYKDVFGDIHPIRFQYVYKIGNLGEAIAREHGFQILPVNALSQMRGWKKCEHPEHNQAE